MIRGLLLWLVIILFVALFAQPRPTPTRELHCTNGARPIVVRGRPVGCQR